MSFYKRFVQSGVSEAEAEMKCVKKWFIKWMEETTACIWPAQKLSSALRRIWFRRANNRLTQSYPITMSHSFREEKEYQ